MTTEAIYALFPDSKFVHGGDHLMHRSVGAFLAVVERLHQEITVTDCKVYNPLPPFLGHRHEFTMVVANVDGKEVQVIFERMGNIKTHIEESMVTVHLGSIQDYFAHHFGMTSPPKYTCHLTWKGEDAPKLHCLAESAKKISKMIEDDVSLGRIKPHQCSLFARSVLAVMTTLFPGYVMVLPGPVDGPLHHLYGLLYSWFDKRNYEVLKVTQGVLRQLKSPQISPSKQTEKLLAQI